MNHTENQPPAIGRAKTRKELADELGIELVGSYHQRINPPDYIIFKGGLGKNIFPGCFSLKIKLKMDKLKFLAVLAFTAMTLSCNGPEKEIPEELIPQPYQIISTSFGLPSLGISFEETEDVCQSLNVYQELSYGGNSGYEYINGLNFEERELLSVGIKDIDNISVRFFMRGFEEIFSSRLEGATLYSLCRDNPEQCFGNLLVVHNSKWYKAIEYQAIPFHKEYLDMNANYSYEMLSEPFRMECFENRMIIPVSFEYDGFLYTEDKQDSLKVSDFKTQFWVMESF